MFYRNGRRYFEGVQDFKSFGDYIEQWIKPNLLEDLHTAFEGAKRMWSDKKKADKMRRDGRGDFTIAIPLLVAFDHIGAFFAIPEETIRSHENIARTARHLEDLRGICAIIGNLGRDALVHSSWPNAGVPIAAPPRDWLFMLSFSASADLNHHQELRCDVSLPGPGSIRRHDATILRLNLNLHVLREALERWLLSGIWSGTDMRESFKRVQEYTQLVADPGKKAQARARALLLGQREQPWSDETLLKDQITALRAEAIRRGATKQMGVYIRRQPEDILRD